MKNEGVFHESWYEDKQLKLLEKKVKNTKNLEGEIIEIGCWEGKSTVVIANACYPENVDAVDTWKGNLDESPDHISVQIARERDVFSVFQENVKKLTKGNINPYKQDCFLYLEKLANPVKFCHIDASHDYKSVKKTLHMLLPKLVDRAIICGDDYAAAHIGRKDLEGGVERAVKEMCPLHFSNGNFWWYIHLKKHSFLSKMIYMKLIYKKYVLRIFRICKALAKKIALILIVG